MYPKTKLKITRIIDKLVSQIFIEAGPSPTWNVVPKPSNASVHPVIMNPSNPKTIVKDASNIRGIVINKGDSLTPSFSFVNFPKTTIKNNRAMYNALNNVASKASIMKIEFRPDRIDTRISSLLKNPLRGGIPPRDSTPIVNAKVVTGIRFRTPPILKISVSLVPRVILPADKNRRALPNACTKR